MAEGAPAPPQAGVSERGCLPVPGFGCSVGWSLLALWRTRESVNDGSASASDPGLAGAPHHRDNRNPRRCCCCSLLCVFPEPLSLSLSPRGFGSPSTQPSYHLPFPSPSSSPAFSPRLFLITNSSCFPQSIPSPLLFRLLPLTHKYQQSSHLSTSPYLLSLPIHTLTLPFPHHLSYASLLTTLPPPFPSSSTISSASLRCQGYLLSSTPSSVCSSSSAPPALPAACAPFRASDTLAPNRLVASTTHDLWIQLIECRLLTTGTVSRVATDTASLENFCGLVILPALLTVHHGLL